MTLKTSLIITGDATAAVTAVDSLTRAVDAAGNAGKRAAPGLGALDQAQDQAAASAREMQAAEAAALAEMRELARAASAASGAVIGNTAAYKQHAQAANDNAAAMQRHAFGVRNLGQQVGDLSVMIGGGIDPMRAFATQAGQMGYALSEMNGKAGAVGAFLTGPWGIALTVAVTALAPFVAQLFEGGDAADALKDKTLSLEDAFAKQAFATDAARKAIEDYNAQQAQARKSDSLTIDIALRLADARLKQARATVEATRASIAQARAQLQVDMTRSGGPGQRGELGTLAAGETATRLGRLQTLEGQQSTTLGTIEQAQRNLFIQRGRKVAEGAADPVARLTQQYDRMRDSAIRAAAGNTTLAKSLDATLSRIERQRASAVDQQRDAERTSRKRASHTTGSSAGTTGRRAAAKDASEARELDGLVRQLTSAFDPAQRAADTYRDTLNDIAKVVASGRLSPVQGAAYEAGALQQYREAAGKVEQESFERIFASSIVEANRDLDAIVQSTTDSFRVRLGDGAKAAGDTLQEGVDKAGSAFRDAIGDVGDLFGVNIGGALQSLASSGKRATQYEDVFGSKAFDMTKSLGMTDDQAGKLGVVIGKNTGKVLAGAQDGQTVAGIAKMLGVKTSSTGGAIGGAIGGLSGIPGGSIIGGLLGGVVGGLFKKSPKGAVSITGMESSSYSGSGKYADALSGDASSVQQSLAKIAEQLGATTGGFGVAIGKHGNWYHVAGDANADVAAKHPKSPLIYEGKDEGAAIAAALKNAIADGAIIGLSGAVAKALNSSTDIDKSLKEALKVQEVETLMGGVLGQYQKAFKDFEATAKERVRIAGQYGFDVLAIEKRNADDRAKLTQQLAQTQVGSLKALVHELTSGSLFEGSALEKITALNTLIAKAKGDLDSGVEGAGDQLASLYEQRLTASKSAYGTTSGYAADRSNTIAEAQAAVARVNARIAGAQAQPTSDPALATTNAALDENNDQNARIIAAIEQGFVGLSSQINGGGRASIADLYKLGAY